MLLLCWLSMFYAITNTCLFLVKIDNPVLLFLMIVFAYMIAKKQGWGNDCRELNWNNTKNKLVMKLLISVLG